MINRIGTAATAVALGALAPLAWAQNSPPADRPSPAHPSSAVAPVTASPGSHGTVRREADPLTYGSHHATRRADDIIGKAIHGSDGAELGRIRDLVIDTQTGQITYAIVSSGGVVGIGGSRRAVPLAALSSEGDRDGLTVAIDRARWEGAPTFREDQLSTLAQRSQGESIYQYYGQTWNTAGATVPAAVPAVSGAAVGQAAESFGGAAIGTNLVLASNLEDKDIRNGEREVGEIEDVLVDLDRQRASLLVELDDDFAGSEESYVVGFNHLRVTGTGNDLVVTTQLTSADFQSSAAAMSAASTASADRPYVWRDGATMETRVADRPNMASERPYSTPGDRPASGATQAEVRYSDATANPQNRPTTPATSDAGRARAEATPASGVTERDVTYSSATSNPQNRPTSPASANDTSATAPSSTVASARTTVDAVRQALREDSTLQTSADAITVSATGDGIVLSGTVATRDDRDRAVQTARSAAAGQRIEDRIRVTGAAE